MHDPRVIDSAGDGLLRWGGAFKRHHGASVDAATESGEVFGVCGAACVIPRRVFDELGGFDEDFFVSHEDVDLSYRARLLGYPCRYVADAIVRHHGSVTLGRVSPFAVFHGQRNLEWMYLKNTPASLLLRTMPGHLVYTAAAAVHFTRTGLLGPFLRAKWSALVGLPRLLRKRAHVQRTQTRRRRRDLAAPRATLAGDEAAREAVRSGSGRRQPVTPELAAVIVNYNAGAELRTALQSIADEMTGRAWEAVVVDNASDGRQRRHRRRVRASRAHRAEHRQRRVRPRHQSGRRRVERAARADHESRLPPRARRGGDDAGGARGASAMRDRRTAGARP